LESEKMKNEEKSKKIEVKVYIYRDMAESFKKIARENGKSRSELFSEILIQFLKDMVR
jgi:metal-responsive CopG/Arc/MetJ family transcriptional regulator